ncbi:MAG: hypothetical protein R6V40_01310 [Candidatus Moraniibacteriota bacterium]
MSKQKFFRQFPAAEKIAKNFFRMTNLEHVEVGVKKVDENLLSQKPYVENYHSQSFCRDNGRKVWLVYSNEFFVEVDPIVCSESATNPGSYREVDSGIQIWKKILVQGIPEYIVEVSYNLADDTGKKGVKIIAHKVKSVVEIEEFLLKISKRSAPVKAHKAAKKFCGKHDYFLIGFIYFPEWEHAGEQVVVTHRRGANIIRID